MNALALDQQCQGLFHEFFEGGEEFSTESAVDRAVITGERHRHHGRDRWRAIPCNYALLAGADRQNRSLRRIDHSVKMLDAQHPHIRDAKCTTLEFFEVQFAASRPCRQIFGLKRDL